MYLTRIGEYFDIFCAQNYPVKSVLAPRAAGGEDELQDDAVGQAG